MTTVTVTIPDWFLWVITIAMVITTVLKCYNFYLEQKLRKLSKTRGPIPP